LIGDWVISIMNARALIYLWIDWCTYRWM